MICFKYVNKIEISRERYVEPFESNECLTVREVVLYCGDEIIKFRLESEDSCNYLPIPILVDE